MENKVCGAGKMAQLIKPSLPQDEGIGSDPSIHVKEEKEKEVRANRAALRVRETAIFSLV